MSLTVSIIQDMSGILVRGRCESEYGKHALTFVREDILRDRISIQHGENEEAVREFDRRALADDMSPLLEWLNAIHKYEHGNHAVE